MMNSFPLVSRVSELTTWLGLLQVLMSELLPYSFFLFFFFPFVLSFLPTAEPRIDSRQNDVVGCYDCFRPSVLHACVGFHKT